MRKNRIHWLDENLEIQSGVLVNQSGQTIHVTDDWGTELAINVTDVVDPRLYH